MGKQYHASINHSNAGVAKLISDKVNFRAKTITKDSKIYSDKSVNLPRRHSDTHI